MQKRFAKDVGLEMLHEGSAVEVEGLLRARLVEFLMEQNLKHSNSGELLKRFN